MTVPANLVAKYRHSRGCKRNQFSDVDDAAALPISAADAAAIGVVDATTISVHDPFDTLPGHLAQQMVFIIKVGEKHYLVNTEGYDYCRYIMPCVIADPAALRLVTVAVTVVVQEGTRPEKWIGEAVSDGLEMYTGEEFISATIISDEPVEA